MARPLRIEYPDVLYHLTSRGNAQEDIFSDDADHLEFLSVLAGLFVYWCQSRMVWGS